MKKLSPEKKLEIYREFLHRRNKSAVARQYNLDRSYLYEIIKDCDEHLLEYLKHKKTGRQKEDVPASYPDALEQIEGQNAQILELEKKNEDLYIKNEFLTLRLSWAERDEKSRHLKKTKSKKP
jgi:transposase-like protein